MCRTTAMCTRCGREFLTTEMVRSASRKRGMRGKLVCLRCDSTNESYHAENDKVMGTDKVNEVFDGIEFESSYSDAYARNMFFEYGFIGTHDGSLDSDGNGQRYGYWDGNTSEYVSPLMKGLNRASKFALSCEYMIQNGHLKVNESCGTHFHVSIDSMKDSTGNNVGRDSYMNAIRRFYHSLFIPLNHAVASDREKAEKVFGRFFNQHYCHEITNSARPESDRYLWINVLAHNNIEFRLNRFTSAKQYQNLMKMEVEMTKCIVKNFCEHFTDEDFDRSRYSNIREYRKHKADMTAKKLVRLYEKFSNNL